jgi:hypothetical protein
MSTVDPRRVIGASITAKAAHVSNLAEFTRSNKKTKLLLGTVAAVTNTCNCSTNRNTMTITGDYNLGGGTMKQTTLNIRSVHPYIAPPNPLAVPPITPDNSAEDPVLDDRARLNARIAANLAADPALAAATMARAAATAPSPTNPPPAADPPPAANPPPATTYPAATAVPAGPVPAANAHGTKWFVDLGIAVNNLNNRDCAPKEWQMKDAVGEKHSAGSDKCRRMSRFDYFLLMFPPRQLAIMLALTKLNHWLLIARSRLRWESSSGSLE